MSLGLAVAVSGLGLSAVSRNSHKCACITASLTAFPITFRVLYPAKSVREMVAMSIPDTRGQTAAAAAAAASSTFFEWAISQVRAISALGDPEVPTLALVSLKECLSTVPVGGIDRYAYRILDACQGVLEDGSMPWAILPALLGVLPWAARHTALFAQRFQDIADLLLGWALEPDLPTNLRVLITDSFGQFKPHWVESLPFSSSILAKVLGDIEVLASSTSPSTPGELRRILSLATCLAAVAEATDSGLASAAPSLLQRFLSCCWAAHAKFTDATWGKEALRCVRTFARLLERDFACHYQSALSFLLAQLELQLSAQEVHTLLLLNLQLLDAQKDAVKPEVVQQQLAPESQLAKLRLHPSKPVATAAIRTYNWLLRHPSQEIGVAAAQAVLRDLQHQLRAIPSAPNLERRRKSDSADEAVETGASLGMDGAEHPGAAHAGWRTSDEEAATAATGSAREDRDFTHRGAAAATGVPGKAALKDGYPAVEPGAARLEEAVMDGAGEVRRAAALNLVHFDLLALQAAAALLRQSTPAPPQLLAAVGVEGNASVAKNMAVPVTAVGDNPKSRVAEPSVTTDEGVRISISAAAVAKEPASVPAPSSGADHTSVPAPSSGADHTSVPAPSSGADSTSDVSAPSLTWKVQSTVRVLEPPISLHPDLQMVAVGLLRELHARLEDWPSIETMLARLLREGVISLPIPLPNPSSLLPSPFNSCSPYFILPPSFLSISTTLPSSLLHPP
ncbi:Serine/threonine-protein kinase smg1 [Cymbomonas tetramitiformis]|uniref:Serine/threonine-protein kinase smg1 n=1 Tax=Cymbomonas tetramitiformis TaxID=36881 RepID=A0AAE0KYT5_9CHLO|nr:Serine/threonine-protein kinase smg1 [Cymbomonas tetramitiformis]